MRLYKLLTNIRASYKYKIMALYDESDA